MTQIVLATLLTLVLVDNCIGAINLYHPKTGKYLDSSGLGSDSQLVSTFFGSSCDIQEGCTIYPLGQYGIKALEIHWGCHEHYLVSVGPVRTELFANQRFTFNGDGTVTSACNSNWRLHMAENGNQTVEVFVAENIDDFVFKIIPA